MNFRIIVLLFIACLCLPSTASFAADPPSPGTLYLHPERLLVGEVWEQAERGVLYVPAIRDAPERGTISLEIYRFRGPESETPRPPVFLLHGGPGWPGLGDRAEDPTYWDERIQPLTALTDVVYVGQRGFGSSKPDTRCSGEALAEGTSPEIFAQASKACREAWEAHVPLEGLNVIEAAADVDDVRRALGYEKIVLWGGSFGSHWSLAVMRFHPQIVARAVLTGLEGPNHTYDVPSEVLAGLERIAEEAQQDARLAALIPEEGLLAAYRKLIERAEKSPIEVRFRDSRTAALQTVVLTADDLREAVRGTTGSARRRGSLPRWPAEMLEMLHGDFRRAAASSERRPRMPNAGFFTLDCGSGIDSARAAQIAADPAVDVVGRIAEFYDASCPEWDVDLGEEFRRNFATEIPTVLVHGDWDLSTPYENALELAPWFKNSRFVTVRRGTHGVLWNSLRELPEFREALLSFVANGDLDGVPEEIEMPPIRWEIPELEDKKQADELLDVARAYLHAMYVESDFDALAGFLAEDAVWEDPTMDFFKDENGHGETRRYVGRDAIVEFYRWANQDGETEVSLDIESAFATGDRVMLDILYTSRADGALMGYPGKELRGTNRGFTILTIRDGEIVRHLDHVDYADMMRQVREQTTDP